MDPSLLQFSQRTKFERLSTMARTETALSTARLQLEPRNCPEQVGADLSRSGGLYSYPFLRRV